MKSWVQIVLAKDGKTLRSLVNQAPENTGREVPTATAWAFSTTLAFSKVREVYLMVQITLLRFLSIDTQVPGS